MTTITSAQTPAGTARPLPNHPASKAFREYARTLLTLPGVWKVGWNTPHTEKLRVHFTHPDLKMLADNVLRDSVMGANLALLDDSPSTDAVQAARAGGVVAVRDTLGRLRGEYLVAGDVQPAPAGGAGGSHRSDDGAPAGVPWYDHTSNAVRAISGLPGVWDHSYADNNSRVSFATVSDKHADSLRGLVNEYVGLPVGFYHWVPRPPRKPAPATA